MEGSRMTTYTAHEATGIDALVTVTFDALPGATTLSGATVAVNARNTVTGTKYVGTATVTSGTTIRCTFAAWALPAGTYSVQVRATPSGYSAQTVADATFVVKTSASAA
jgi:hypothetical protein